MENKSDIVPGFLGSAVASGIKKDGGLDLALIYSEKETVAAGVFTTNQVKAAPVLLSREHIKDGKIKAIIVNSGNANACTGQAGMDIAQKTAEQVAGELGIQTDEVLVASTGVIGVPLNMDLISNAIPDLVKSLSPEGVRDVAGAIMTTDSFPKVSLHEGVVNDSPYQVLGIAKGAGMIMPDMATMLCFIFSNIHVDPVDLKEMLSSGVERTFNRIIVDGDTSTNDMVLAMVNGLAGNEDLSQSDREAFRALLNRVMHELSTMIVKDGEGATKLIHIYVEGAATERDALTAARTIANSNLVKTAFYGQDPNWGRIMAALGRSGIQLREESVSISIDNVKIVEGGVGMGTVFEKEAAKRMAQREFSVTVDLNLGQYKDLIVTCDLTHEYISINADYRT